MKNTRATFYFVLSVAGLITAWYFNGIAVMNAQDYLQAWFDKEVDWVLAMDLTIVAIAGATFMVLEGRRLKMKRVWLYIVLSGVTAMAATFPFFLGMRERKLAALNRAGTPDSSDSQN